jgi:hypothetical protein
MKVASNLHSINNKYSESIIYKKYIHLTEGHCQSQPTEYDTENYLL